MRKSCKHTHSHRAYFTENILNVKELAIPFSLVSLTVSSNLYLRNGAPPLRVAAREALHQPITALPIGTLRALLETPYFCFNHYITAEYMNNGCSGAYEAPQVEIMEVAVERGFAVSSVDVGPWGNGGHLGDHDTE